MFRMWVGHKGVVHPWAQLPLLPAGNIKTYFLLPADCRLKKGLRHFLTDFPPAIPRNPFQHLLRSYSGLPSPVWSSSGIASAGKSFSVDSTTFDLSLFRKVSTNETPLGTCSGLWVPTPLSRDPKLCYSKDYLMQQLKPVAGTSKIWCISFWCRYSRNTLGVLSRNAKGTLQVHWGYL